MSDAASQYGINGDDATGTVSNTSPVARLTLLRTIIRIIHFLITAVKTSSDLLSYLLIIASIINQIDTQALFNYQTTQLVLNAVYFSG